MQLLRARKWSLAASCVVIAAGAISPNAGAQTTTGSIFGTVSDDTGALVPNATVVITNVQTGISRTAQSNASGNYIFPALNSGDYNVTSRVPGFSAQTITGVHLDASQSRDTSFILKVGAESQEITVGASSALVETRQSQLADTVDQRRIQDLPLNGRDPYALVQLVPGVAAFSAQPPIGNQFGTTFSVNGNRSGQNTSYLDGAYDNALFTGGGNILPNPDALQEFRVLTSNFDAEFGRYPGAVVNAITRSGTNSFHGHLHEYIRNDALNSRTYFNPIVTPLKQNQFGGTVGGPIIRNKAFFFLSYEGLRIHTPLILNGTALVTLTPAEAMGDFSASAKKPNLDPKYTCGNPFIVCSTQLDPVVQNLINQGYLPLNVGNTGHPANQSAPANTTQNQGLARVDYQLSKHLISGTFFQSRGIAANPGISGNQVLTYAGAQIYSGVTNIAATDVWTLNANMLNTLRLFYTLNHFDQGNLYNKATWAGLGSKISTAALPLTPPEFTVNGYFSMGLGSGGPDNLRQPTMGVEDTFILTRGNHTVKMGGAYLWSNYREHGEYLGTGQATFNGSVTGSAAADFILGKASTFRQNNGAVHALHLGDPSLFAQDDWRVSHKLTLNLGIRWEIFAPFTGDNNVGTFRSGATSTRFPNAPLGLLTSGDPGIPDGILATNYKAFTPRVGFAYDAFGDGKTSLRGGFGMFYGSRSASQITNPVQQPFIVDITKSNVPNLVDPYAGTSPFPYTLNPTNPQFVSGTTISAIPPSATFPYVYEYNLTVEQQLTSSLAMRLGYVGSVTHKSYITRDINTPTYNPTLGATPASIAASLTTAGLNNRRPYQPTPNSYVFSSIVSAAEGNGNYNSLQAQLTQNLKHGMSFKASYVWSKSLDISSSEPSNITLTLVNQYNPRADYGRSTFDTPHRFTASYIYQEPAFNHFGFVGREFLGGWQVNGITTLSTGRPFTVTSGVDANLDGVNTDRPNQVLSTSVLKGQSTDQQAAMFFNTAAFQAIQPGAQNPYGNVPRSSLVGPRLVNVDMSFFKDFGLEKVPGSIQFRAELFNIFNIANLANPTAVQSSPNFGKITALLGGTGPRIIQLALRYNF